MDDNYEYRDFGLPPNASGPSKDTIRSLLQPLGDDAWEIMSVQAKREFDRGGMTFGPWSMHDNPLHRWVTARRPSYGTPGPSSWEYTGLNVSGMPRPNWYDHIASRGWQQVEGTWYSYFQDDWYVFKRTDEWRGTDDGDIGGALTNLGFNLRAAGATKMVTEILDTKWQLSMEAGHDVGTQHAVDVWRSRQ
jgi:hypothetical protein